MEVFRTDQEKLLYTQVNLQSRILEESGTHFRNLSKLLHRTSSSHQTYLAQSRKTTSELVALQASLRDVAPPGTFSTESPAAAVDSPAHPPAGEEKKKDRKTRRKKGKPAAKEPTVAQTASLALLIQSVEHVVHLHEQIQSLQEELGKAHNQLGSALDQIERAEIHEGKKVKKGFDKIIADYVLKSKQLKLAEQKKNAAPDKLQSAQAEMNAAQSVYVLCANAALHSLEQFNVSNYGNVTRELRQLVSSELSIARTSKGATLRAYHKIPVVQIPPASPPHISASSPSPSPSASSSPASSGTTTTVTVESPRSASPERAPSSAASSPITIHAAATSPTPSPSSPTPPAHIPPAHPTPTPPTPTPPTPAPASSAPSSPAPPAPSTPSQSPSPSPLSLSAPSESPYGIVGVSPGFVPATSSVRVASTPAAAPAPPVDDPKLGILRDFLPIQLDYLETLRAGVNHTMLTFSTDESLNSRVFSEDRALLFGNLPELMTQAQSFYEELERAIRVWPETQPGSLFARHQWAPVYRPFLANYPQALSLIDRCGKASKHFQAWAAASNPTTLRNLPDLLTAPLTLLRHYEHLLESLNMETPTSHPDHQPLISTYTEVTALVADVMVAEEHTRNLRDLWQLSERMKGSKELGLLSDPSRAVAHEGAVTVEASLPPSSGSRADDDEEIRLILLSDCLVEAASKRKGKKLTFKKRIGLDLARLEQMPSAPTSFQIRMEEEHDITHLYHVSTPAEKAAWVSAIQQVLKKLHRNKIFGIPLDQLMALSRERLNDIPSLVQKTVDEVIARGLKVEGIFRLSGAAAQIRRIRKRLDAGEEVSFKTDNPDCVDIHVVAGTLKLWIRSLPEPLMPSEAFIPLAQQISADAEGNATEALVLRTKQAVEALPTYHRFLIHHLVSFFELISGFADSNKMNPHNVAIVFAPNLIGGPAGIMDPSLHKFIFGLVEFMIENCDEIFADISVERRVMKANILKEQQTPQSSSS